MRGLSREGGSTLCSDHIQPPRELRSYPPSLRNERCTGTLEVDPVRTLTPSCRTDTLNLSGIVVHLGRILCARGDGTPRSIQTLDFLEEVGSRCHHLRAELGLPAPMAMAVWVHLVD